MLASRSACRFALSSGPPIFKAFPGPGKAWLPKPFLRMTSRFIYSDRKRRYMPELPEKPSPKARYRGSASSRAFHCPSNAKAAIFNAHFRRHITRRKCFEICACCQPTSLNERPRGSTLREETLPLSADFATARRAVRSRFAQARTAPSARSQSHDDPPPSREILLGRTLETMARSCASCAIPSGCPKVSEFHERTKLQIVMPDATLFPIVRVFRRLLHRKSATGAKPKTRRPGLIA
mgnify:CR=1 FL=1